MASGRFEIFEWDEQVLDTGYIDENVLGRAGLLDGGVGLFNQYAESRSVCQMPMCV
jgi:hypothetical protein